MHVLNVLYQTNEYYAAITGVSMTSLLINNENIDEINIYILDDNIAEDSRKKFKTTANRFGRNVFFLETGTILQRLQDLKVAPFKGKIGRAHV